MAALAPAMGGASSHATVRAGPQAHGTLKDYEAGFVHVDVKHLPEPRDRDGTTCKRHLHVAIGRASHYMHSTARDDETAASAVAFLTDAFDAFPFRVTHAHRSGPLLRGRCFKAACERHGGAASQDASSHAKTDGTVDRFDGRVRREVPRIMIHDNIVDLT